MCGGDTPSGVLRSLRPPIPTITLPVGKHLSSERNDAQYIFTHSANLTTWPTGWAFMLAWMSPIWTIGDFDSCVHISEEASLYLPTPKYPLLNSTLGL
jgi:hypothetical protein